MKKLFMFFIAVALIAGFSVPAAAADAEWNFYGSARMSTFSYDRSKERPVDATGTPGAVTRQVDGSPSRDDKDTVWDLQGNSRIGAKVSAGDVGGQFEYGTGVNVRVLYGTWNFGAGTLTVGQGYTPMMHVMSNQVADAGAGQDNDLVFFGGLFSRRPMIQVKFADLKIALVTPSTNAIGDMTGSVAGADVDTTLPKLEVSYQFKTDMFTAGFRGAYNSYEVETDAKDYDIDSYIGVLYGSVKLGPAYINASYYIAQNEGNYGLNVSGGPGYVFDTTALKVKDTDNMGYFIVGGVKLSDMLAFEAGYGFSSNEVDVVGAKDDDASSYYVQAVIGLAPGVMIIPEVGKYDYDKDGAGNKEGDVTYFGAKWQINF